MLAIQRIHREPKWKRRLLAGASALALCAGFAGAGSQTALAQATCLTGVTATTGDVTTSTDGNHMHEVPVVFTIPLPPRSRT